MRAGWFAGENGVTMRRMSRGWRLPPSGAWRSFEMLVLVVDGLVPIEIERRRLPPGVADPSWSITWTFRWM